VARTTEKSTTQKLFQQRNEARAEVERLTEALRRANEDSASVWKLKLDAAVQEQANLAHAALTNAKQEYVDKLAEVSEYHKGVNRKLLEEKDLVEKHLSDTQARVKELEDQLKALDADDVKKLRKRLAKQSDVIARSAKVMRQLMLAVQEHEKHIRILQSRIPGEVLKELYGNVPQAPAAPLPEIPTEANTEEATNGQG
jgi:Fe2+ transport system protein B